MSPMPVKTVTKLIDESPFFKELDEETRELLSSKCKLKAFMEGQVLTREGDSTKDVFLINRGEVVVKSHVAEGEEEVVLAILKEGQIVGEVSAAMGVPRTSTVEALDMVEVVVIPVETLEEVMDRHPEVKARLVETVAERATEAMHKVQK